RVDAQGEITNIPISTAGVSAAATELAAAQIAEAAAQTAFNAAVDAVVAGTGNVAAVESAAAALELAETNTILAHSAVEKLGTNNVASGFDTWNPWGDTPFGMETGAGNTAGNLVGGLAWGLTAYFAGKMLAGMFGESEEQAEAIGYAAAAGFGVGRFMFLQNPASNYILGGLGVGLVVLYLTYRKEKIQVVNFQCLPWEAPLGGEKCEECNADEFRPCSEYRCRSLGQACEIVNAGSEEEKCVWVNPHDVTSPTIETWEDALTEGHSYVPHATRPPALGTRIVRDGSPDGCLQAFTPLEFGIVNNEPASCKIDVIHKDSFEEMNFYMDDNNYFLYNHTQTMSLPSPNSVNAENPEISEDGIYDLYIRCQDKNGNENV
ncbi:MAG: hypothetical protein QF535_04030, partial [Anaerolineales bacterium]|nr:hypothetical protein [Anaerolineales bacterium]